MIIDNETLFSNDQAITATGSTASEDVYDFGMTSPTVNDSKLFLWAQVTTSFASSGAPTMVIQCETDADAAFSDTAILLRSTDALAKATLVAGYMINLPLPIHRLERYMRVMYVVSTAVYTAGKISAGLVLGAPKQVYFSS